MGCGCGGSRKVRSYKNKSRGYSVQPKTTKAKAIIIKKKAPKTRSFAVNETKTCSKCNKPMKMVSRYDSSIKKLIKFWICQNRICRNRVKV